MNWSSKIKEYHFEFRHLTVLFIVLISFQLIITLINKNSINRLLNETQDWYQKESAENLANLTATSLELLVESIGPHEKITDEKRNKIIQSFDIIFSQQKLQHNIEELCILVMRADQIIAIDQGVDFYNYLFEHTAVPDSSVSHTTAVKLYKEVGDELKRNEQIKSIIQQSNIFHIFTPFVVRGEFVGAVYMKNVTDFSVITDQIITTYDENTLIYISLILLGLIAMYFISSFTVKERDEAQKELLDEHERNIKKQIDYEKEIVFTKRIYHTHHKAEKVMGFIKEDLRTLNKENINDIKYRVSKYSNFISRVIYDMKWYDPPVQTIRSSSYNTNLNEVIIFLINNLFKRISKQSDFIKYDLRLDGSMPCVQINEFVIWELLEPLIQNAVEHSAADNVTVTITTRHDADARKSYVIISDNGKGIDNELLESNENKIKKIFLENISTKQQEMPQSGYGCYIAYQIAKRCGWHLDAENNENGGSRFVITI